MAGAERRPNAASPCAIEEVHIINTSGVDSNHGGAEMHALFPGAGEADKGEMMLEVARLQ